MKRVAGLLVVAAVIGSAMVHPVAIGSSVVLAVALLPTVDRQMVAVLLVALVAAQDAGLRIDAAPARSGHEQHA